ncbi:hypothetical protein BC833DRAFT_575277, partial [Globomyces pollinis-pini]
MAPKESCSCGSTKWKKINNGEYVCQYGHQYLAVEQIGDDAEFIGSQKFFRSQRKRKRDKETLIQKKRSYPHTVLNKFQKNLKDQLEWLITKQGFPRLLENVVHDMWSIWLSRLATGYFDSTVIEEFVTLNVDISLQHIKENISPHVTLIFLRLGCIFLKIPITMTDLLGYIFTTDFPYFFEPTISRYTVTHLQGYNAVPRIEVLSSHESIIANQLISSGVQLIHVKDHPSIILKMFNDLLLPIELYPLYKCLIELIGKRESPDCKRSKPYLLTGTVLCWIARLYLREN